MLSWADGRVSAEEMTADSSKGLQQRHAGWSQRWSQQGVSSRPSPCDNTEIQNTVSECSLEDLAHGDLAAGEGGKPQKTSAVAAAWQQSAVMSVETCGNPLEELKHQGAEEECGDTLWNTPDTPDMMTTAKKKIRPRKHPFVVWVTLFQRCSMTLHCQLVVWHALCSRFCSHSVSLLDR